MREIEKRTVAVIAVTVLLLLSGFIFSGVNVIKVFANNKPVSRMQTIEIAGEPSTDDIDILADSINIGTIMPNKEPTYYVEVVDGYITPESLYSICDCVGSKYGIDPYLLQALVYVESTNYIYAESYCGAKGLTQIMDGYHVSRMNKLGVIDIYDPYSNILVCADYLDEISRNYAYGDDVVFVLMAYNMGPANAKPLYESGVTSTYARKVLNQRDYLKEN